MCVLNRLNRHTRFVAAGVFAWALVTGAVAQPALLPANLVQAGSLAPDQVASIAAAIKPHVEALSGPADAIGAARRQLLSPLAATGNPSVPFRLRYAEEVSKQLAPVLSGSNQMAKINALVIAGELSTSDAARLLATSRKDTDPSVRFQAADAGRAILATYANSRGSTLLADDDARSLVSDIAKAIASEKDPLVQDALLASLEAALPSTKLQEAAAKSLADAANTIARNASKSAADTRLLEAFERVANTMSDLLIRQGNAMVAPVKIAIGDFAASSLWHTKQAIAAKAVPGGADQPLRDAYSRLAQSSENLILRAGTSLDPTLKVSPKNTGSKVGQGNTQGDASFVADANELIAVVTTPPFGVNASRYK
jgi:hypothetical protein